MVIDQVIDEMSDEMIGQMIDQVVDQGIDQVVDQMTGECDEVALYMFVLFDKEPDLSRAGSLEATLFPPGGWGWVPQRHRGHLA